MQRVQRGEIWLADRRPVLVIQVNAFNRSRIQTVIVAVITSNVDIADAPGNVLLPAKATRLNRDSVVNVSQVFTLDREFLAECVGALPARLGGLVDAGLRVVMGL
jgi:mRNA interferase MazF